MEKRRVQNNRKCADVPSTRTRRRYPSCSDAYEDKTVQHIGSHNFPNLEWLSQKWQTYFSTPTSSSSSSWSQNSTWWNSQHWEDSQQWRQWQTEEWQETKCGGRNGKRRQHTILLKLERNIVSTVSQVALSSPKFLCSLAHSPVMFLFKKAKQTKKKQISRPDNSECLERDGGAQITLHRTHACAHFCRLFIQCNGCS